MNSPIITKVIEEMNNLPDNLQQQALQFVTTLRQRHTQPSGNVWDVLESLTRTAEVPADWSDEHDHYLYDTPKHRETELWLAIAS
ncbi:MAG: hypothetical protein OHK0037_11020 [Elainellaceae cyanobacterium]